MNEEMQQQQTEDESIKMFNQSRKERRAERREARDHEVVAGRRSQKLKDLSRWIVIIIVIAGVGYGAWKFLSKSAPQGDDKSVGYPILGRDHIAVGSTHDPYNSNPPTSGPHYEIPARLGLYDVELPDERVIHNLEHGEIWISYNPRVKGQVVEAIKSIMNSHMVVTPRSKNDTDIALAAWGRLDAFNLDGKPLDLQRVKDFINRYQNQGPEHVDSNAMIPSVGANLEADPIYKP